MRCPFCKNSDSQVVETRDAEEGASIRRRRQCIACSKRFTTYEKAEIYLPAVVKTDGTREDFLSSKILRSMRLALRKRPVSVEQIDQALIHIEQQLLSSKQKEISSKLIGDLVMIELKKLDLVGYVRFVSVYKSFASTDEFKQLISDMNENVSVN